MGQSIAVMNTKGGVGKSTVVMALAETLSVYRGKTVLVIDSDSQTSMSCMLMDIARWEQIERRQRTIVDYLVNQVLGPADQNWRDYVTSGVSDVDEAQSIYLMPSHMELTLFEREVSTQKREVQLRAVIRTLLAEARQMFDVIIVDCPPGLSLLTECWLRECDYLIPPTKPDYLGVRGFSILKRFLEQYSDQGFARLMGVLVNLKDDRTAIEEEWHRRLASDPTNRCFESFVPRRAYIQRASSFEQQKRTYIAKYPGDAGQCMRNLADEVLSRMGEAKVASQANASATAAATEAPVKRPAEEPPKPAVVPAAAKSAPAVAAPAPLTPRPPMPGFSPSAMPAPVSAGPTVPPAAEVVPEDEDDDVEVVLNLPQPSERVTGFLAGAAAKETRTTGPTAAPAPTQQPPAAASMPIFRAPVWGGKPALAQTMRVPRVQGAPEPAASSGEVAPQAAAEPKPTGTSDKPS